MFGFKYRREAIKFNEKAVDLKERRPCGNLAMAVLLHITDLFSLKLERYISTVHS